MAIISPSFSQAKVDSQVKRLYTIIIQMNKKMVSLHAEYVVLVIQKDLVSILK